MRHFFAPGPPHGFEPDGGDGHDDDEPLTDDAILWASDALLERPLWGQPEPLPSSPSPRLSHHHHHEIVFETTGPGMTWLFPHDLFAAIAPILLFLSFHEPPNGINVDHMSYEQLLALQERIGHQNRGARQETLDALPIHHFAAHHEAASCRVCMADYEVPESLKTLPCRHHFHSSCIDKWLLINATCPICKSELRPPAVVSAPSTTASS
jgi:E3 ubiquitin-protein ligase BIG BROTHER-like protein